MHKQRSSAPDSWILNPSSVGTSFEKLWQLNRICIPDSIQVLSSCTCMHTYLHARMHTNINQYHRHLAYLVLQMEANKLQIAPSLTSPQIRSWGFLHALHVPGVCGGIVVVFLHFGLGRAGRAYKRAQYLHGLGFLAEGLQTQKCSGRVLKL